ncbi:oxidase ustYa family protein [Aspergillus alliaceus]|uniref:oxidase ustYa family protein n=1 Tax=Petromyces alliaceus TaxID=209559 RepID=UPI0012A3D253|nr:uncharacterized protein BDW43DRAFT_307721 [Aspergillus alliaceus]KAB8237446.1 hypothetical protein BDW43DRAFT_307721 [Aspergillus alliaceus]
MNLHNTNSSKESQEDRHGSDQDRLLESEKGFENDESWSIERRRKKELLLSNWQGWILLLIVVFASLLLGFGTNELYRHNKLSEAQCTQMLSGYSPALEAVEYIDYQFQGEFSDSNVYKGRPRPELDAAWDRASALHELSMEPKHLPLLNKSETAIRYSPEQGGGYMVELEVFHQLHCLNLLRKQIYREYYMRPENMPAMFDVPKKLLYNHIDHCVDTIRQLIMCTGDVSPVTANWVVTHHHPHPDFNTRHKCRNFDKLLEWAEERDHGGVEFRPDSTLLPAPHLSETFWDVEPEASEAS